MRDGIVVLSPTKISGPEPTLPPELAGKSGAVYLTVTIGTNGKVEDVKVVGGDPRFADAVIAILPAGCLRTPAYQRRAFRVGHPVFLPLWVQPKLTAA